jgi:hypothetical protein
MAWRHDGHAAAIAAAEPIARLQQTGIRLAFADDVKRMFARGADQLAAVERRHAVE